MLYNHSTKPQFHFQAPSLPPQRSRLRRCHFRHLHGLFLAKRCWFPSRRGWPSGWFVKAELLCYCWCWCGLSFTHKRSLFKVGHPRRAEKGERTLMSRPAANWKYPGVLYGPGHGHPCCKHHSHVPSQPVSWAATHLVWLQSLTHTHVCTRWLSSLLHLPHLFLFCQHKQRKKTTGMVVVCFVFFFSHCHASMKSSSWNAGIFFNDLKIFNDVVLKEDWTSQIPCRFLTDKPAHPAWLQKKPRTVTGQSSVMPMDLVVIGNRLLLQQRPFLSPH